MAATSDEWAERVKRYLKGELKRAGLSYADSSNQVDRNGLGGNRRLDHRQDQSRDVPCMVPDCDNAGHWKRVD